MGGWVGKIKLPTPISLRAHLLMCLTVLFWCWLQGCCLVLFARTGDSRAHLLPSGTLLVVLLVLRSMLSCFHGLSQGCSQFVHSLHQVMALGLGSEGLIWPLWT